MKESKSKGKAKKITYIMLSLISLACLGIWLFACLFACGQLYDTYDLWVYLSGAPVAVAIIIALLAAFIGFLVAAICVRKMDEMEE